ncbi:hypothetical protein [Thermanaeromonas sp. C210]|uniref:hypothetical protein n=1 Tax=Thermanaeromonas sp. C210 TaxID=2731925 RepID=UPI001566158B|nr:hypothetical protein [Thermanaeromonas sp. C210]
MITLTYLDILQKAFPGLFRGLPFGQDYLLGEGAMLGKTAVLDVEERSKPDCIGNASYL